MAFAAPKIEKAQITKAVTLLTEHVQKENEAKNDLLNSNNEAVFLLFNLAKIPEKAVHKPSLIELPHPLYTEGSECCLFVRDPQRKWKDIFAEKPVNGLVKIIGIDKLKKNYKQHKQKRELCDAFDLFLCDKRCVEMMPQHLGWNFHTKKKMPIPVKVTEEDPHSDIEHALKCTFVRLAQGPTVSVRVGRCNMPIKNIVANAQKVISGMHELLAPLENGIDGVSVQATGAVSLPLYVSERFLSKQQELNGGAPAAAAAPASAKKGKAPAAQEAAEDDSAAQKKRKTGDKKEGAAASASSSSAAVAQPAAAGGAEKKGKKEKGGETASVSKKVAEKAAPADAAAAGKKRKMKAQ